MISSKVYDYATKEICDYAYPKGPLPVSIHLSMLFIEWLQPHEVMDNYVVSFDIP